MALCCIHLTSKPLKNNLFAIRTRPRSTDKNNAKGQQQDKTWKHPPNQTLNCVVYKDAFLHAPSQARRLRPNSLVKDAHNQLQSRFSPEWKLILWQELLNLPETHTATDHKGTSPFPKEGRSKAPANNKAMAYPGVKWHQAQTCTSGKSYEKSRKVCILQG